MSLKIVVLAKQVPDTRNVGKDAMTEEGTVNRAALPAIFNPEDLNALEMALHIKDTVPQTEVYVLTMGPVRAGEIVRQSLYRGADGGFVISDRKVAGSDTLATSYTISQGVKKLGKVDLVLAGRQAIDGDTAQVGPQTAEKLEMPQITYAEEVLYADDKTIRIKRRLERGVEEVECNYPCMVTVGSSAPECRFPIAKQVMKYKNALTEAEAAETGADCSEMFAKKPYYQQEGKASMELKFTLNGKKVAVNVEADSLLIDVVRDLGCLSVKRGCETSNCGLCTVFVNDKPVLSCSVLAPRVEGQNVTTLEGLQDEAKDFGTFVANQGAEQCGFCNPGFMMNAIAMFRENEDPSDEEILSYLTGNLCRCTGYEGQLRSIKAYIEFKKSGKAGA